MKIRCIITLLLCTLVSCLSPQERFNTNYNTQKDVTIFGVSVDQYDEIKHLGEYSDIKLTTRKGIVLYFDPVTIPDKNDADIIFITHTHYDHFDIKKISKVMKDTTIICIPEIAYVETKKIINESNIIVVKPNSKYTIKGFTVETIPAYSLNYHPRSLNWVGYIITIDNHRFYISGDTDFVPEMKTVKTDVAFICIGGDAANAFFNNGIRGGIRGMMNGEEASEAINFIKPEYVFPIHSFWCAHDCDMESFMANIDKTIKVVIMAHQ
jgi:L-ascorbate metabolism protein UlaG (beta-lactamase superfamily)